MGKDQVILQARVWKDLPSELHANILQFCSVPVLCRLRVVCRAWNDLTHKLDFAMRVRSKDMYVFKGPYSINVGSMSSWDDEERNEKITDILRSKSGFFEPSTRRVYPISMECLYDGSMRSRYELLDKCRIMAADRGFVWVLWSMHSGLMQVANLVTKSVVEIPPFGSPAGEYVAGAMTVAENYSSFTLYVLLAIGSQEMARLVRFDSQVGKWQQISMPTRKLTPYHMVKLNDILYLLFWDTWDLKVELLALDTTSDTWSEIGMGLKPHNHVPQLATTLGRLFIVGLNEVIVGDEDDKGDDLNEDSRSIVRIIEIDIISGKCSNIVTFDKDKACDGEVLEYLEYSNSKGAPNMVVVGYGDFIVLTLITGHCIAYNLLSDELEVWRYGKFVDSSNWFDWGEENYGIFVMATMLSLSPVPVPRVCEPRMEQY